MLREYATTLKKEDRKLFPYLSTSSSIPPHSITFALLLSVCTLN